MNRGKKRKRNDSDSEEDSSTKYCAVCKARGGPFWSHNTEECRIVSGYQKYKKKATQNMSKKEFNDLIHAQMMTMDIHLPLR